MTSALLAVFSIKNPANGDTFVYANSIQTLNGPTYHMGYYALGFIIHSVFSKIGMDPLQTLTAMSVISGGIAVAGMYLLSYELTPSIPRSLTAAGALLFSGWFWVFAEHGEVYVPQLAFELITLLAIMRGYPLISSLFFIIAVSITPTSCLLFPVLIYMLIEKKYDRRKMVLFAMPIFITIGIATVFKHREIWEMVWSSIYSPTLFFHEITFMNIVSKILVDLSKVYVKGMNYFLILALFGGVILFLKEKKVFFQMMVILLPFLLYIFNLGLLSGDHLLLTFVPLSVFVASGLNQINTLVKNKIELKAMVAVLLFTVYAGMSYNLLIAPMERDSVEMTRVIGQFEKIADQDSILVAEYTFGVAYWYLTKNEKNIFILTGRPHDYVNKSCDNDIKCLHRLNQSYWINMYHLPNYLKVEKELLKKIEKRTFYFADKKVYRSEFVKKYLPIKYWRNNEGAGFVSRVSKYLSEKLGANISFAEEVESNTHPVYRLNRS